MGPLGQGKARWPGGSPSRLGWRFLDTGAMYRVVTLAALRSGADLASDHDLGKLSDDLEVSWLAGQVLLGREDVTAAIRERRSDGGIQVRG